MPFQRNNKHAARLTKADAFAIRQRWAQRAEAACTQSQLANEYGVSINTVRNVLAGNTFQDVPRVESADQAELRVAQSQAHLAALLEAPESEVLEEIQQAVKPPPGESVIEEIIRARAGEDPLGDWARKRASQRLGTDDREPSSEEKK